MRTDLTVLLKMLAVPLALWALPAAGGTLSGTVKGADGGPLAGVLVRLTDEGGGRSESVFTRADGTFDLATTLAGPLALRLRTPYFRDVSATVTLRSDSAVRRDDLVMQPMTDAAEISASLPAAYHFGSLPFESGDAAVFNRYQFQRDCLTCHQIGNPSTRNARTPAEWLGTIQRMHAYLGNFDAALRDRRSVILAEGFDGKPLAVRPSFPLDASLSRTRITEYRLAQAVVPHDSAINPNDGLLYTVDQGLDHMAITDPATGATEYVAQSGDGMAYHVFGAVAGEIAVFNGRNGPHSMALGPDGKYYVTNTSTNSIGVFDPKARRWEPSYAIGGKANYPHTIRFDKRGHAWFTLAGSEQVGRLDPSTGKIDVVDLPNVTPGGVSGGTTPYGIDVDPFTGMVWYSRLFGDKLGRIDPDTLDVTEFDSPVRGPRRMRFDDKGMLWVTGYSEGMLARVEPREFVSKVYTLPEFAPGFRPAPYALAVNPVTQDIWINENMTDRIFRFIPAEERFVVYPVPLAGTYTRDVDFTADGTACMSNNPIPATALEGGVLEILCIDTNAG